MQPLPVRRKSKKRQSLQSKKRQSISHNATYSVPSYMQLAPKSGVRSQGRRSSIVVKQNDGRIKGANFEGLVEELVIQTKKDSSFIGAFVATHSYFVDSQECLTYLIERFYDGNDAAVCEVFKTWLRTYFEDFAEEMGLFFRMFLSDIRGNGENFEKLADELSELMDKQESLYIANQVKKVKRRDNNLYGVESRIPEFNPSWSAREIAEQLTLAERDLFEKVPLREFLHTAWNKDEKKTGVLEISSLIQRSNYVSFWVATGIVTAVPKKKKKKMIQLFIEIATECLELKNYQTAMQIYSALNLRPVERLEHEWKNLKKSTKAHWDVLNTFFNPMSNFKQYRAIIQTIDAPAIPLLTLILSDLTMIEENETHIEHKEMKENQKEEKRGKKKEIKEEEEEGEGREKKEDNTGLESGEWNKTTEKPSQLIHFEKMRLIHNTLKILGICFAKPYPQARTLDPELLDMVIQLPGVTESELYAIKDEQGEKMVAAWRKDLKQQKKNKQKKEKVKSKSGSTKGNKKGKKDKKGK